MKHLLHKMKHLGAPLALITLLLLPGLGWGQTYLINEGFESTTFPPTGWTNSESGTIRTTNNPRTGSACLGFNGVNDAIYTPQLSNPDQLSFWYRRSSNTTAWTLNVQVSTDASSWTSIGTITNASTTYQEFTYDLSSYSNIYVRMLDQRSTGTHERYVDDFTVTERAGSVSAPTTQASNITFSSIGQTGMTAGWTNGDGSKRIVLMNTSNSFTDPTDGTDPTPNTVYGGSGEQVVYNNSSNSVAVTGLSTSTTYWFRVYEYNGSGTDTKYLTTTATNNPNSQASAAPAPLIASPDPASLSGFSTVAGTASTAQTFTISGSNLTDDLVVTAPTDYEVRENETGSYGSSVSFTPSSGTVSEKTIQVRIAASASVGTPSGNVVCSSTDATSQNVAVSGTVNEPPSITFYFRGPSWMNNNPHDPEIWGPFNEWESAATMTFGDVPGWWSVTVEVADASASIEYQSRFSQDGSTKYQKAFENFSANPTFTTTTGEIWIDASQNESFTWQNNDFYLLQDKITETQPFAEPDNHVTEFSATANSSTAITITWNDSDATGYLIKGSDVSYAAITAPVDGVEEANAALVRNVSFDNGNWQFTGLTAGTTYYFKIYPYNGTGASVNYKTDGTVPEADATTQEVPSIIINEVDADTPGSDVAEFVELYDGGVGNTSLNGLVIVFFNGSNDLSYAAYDLDGKTTDANGYFVLGNTAVPNVGLVFADNTLQNGQDAVALYYDDATSFPNNTPVTLTNLIDAFVYDTDDADDPGLLVLLNSGQPQVNENGRGNGDVLSSQRLPNGTGGSRNTATYDQAIPTPGAANEYSNISWTGTTSSDWAVATNWNPNILPNIISNAIIPDVTNDPVISAAAVCKDLTIATSAVVEIAATGALTVAGTLSNSGSLNIKSTATGTGSLIHSTAGVPATAERYITAATWETAGSGWHLLSSPVASQSISGTWTPTGTGNDYDFYAFDEAATTEYWLNQKVGANNITTFIPGKGYLVAYQQTGTKTFSGNLNVADVTLSGLTNTSGSAYPGWHLAGNPFASAINWGSGTWTKTNINAVAQVWSSADGSYKTTTEQSDIIPAMNGFMVYTTGSGELTIPAGAREHNAANWYKSDEEFILLKANDPEGLTSQSSIVRFNPSATEAYDADFDAYFLAGFAPMFYSVSGSSLYALNTLPAISNELAIPFGFVKNSATNYSIELAKNIPATIVYLTDKKTGTVTNLTDNGAYHFTAAEGDDANRFTLHFGTLGMDDPSTAAPVHIYAYGGVVYLIGLDAKASITITDLTGRVVMAERVNGNGLAMLNAGSLPKGVYVVTAVAGSQVVSAKVIL